MVEHRRVEVPRDLLFWAEFISRVSTQTPLLLPQSSYIPILHFISRHVSIILVKCIFLAFLATNMSFNPGNIVGTLARWDPRTEQTSNPITIDCDEEICIGRDGKRW